MEFSYEQFSYWFEPILKEPQHWNIYNISGTFKGVISNASAPHVTLINPAETEACIANFELFKQRPEYYVGQPVVFEEVGYEPDIYQKLITGAYLLRATKDCKNLAEMQETYATQGPNIEFRLRSMLDWLKKTDFYQAPASTRYHEAYKHGLVQHSLKVYNRLIDLMKTDAFKDVSLASAVITALMHDWCKVDTYEPYMKNVKDDTTGQWHQEKAYRKNQKSIPLGHGVSSMFLASKFLALTPDEALAIRWHMGHWRVCDDEIDELQKANETCPLVHLIQFADQLAIVNY